VKRGEPLRRYTPLTRSTPMRAVSPARRARLRGYVSVRTEVYVRCGGMCELCGLGLRADAFDCHHRLRRSQGGLDDLATCVALHRHCHQWVHDHPHQAMLIGFLCPSTHRVTHWPLHLHRLLWVRPVGNHWESARPTFGQRIGDVP